MKEWQAKAELNIKEKELLQDEQHRVLAAMLRRARRRIFCGVDLAELGGSRHCSD